MKTYLLKSIKSASYNRIFYCCLVFMAVNLYFTNTMAQFYFSPMVGTSASRSFGQFADYQNSQPGVKNKLGNFWLSSGFSTGFEFFSSNSELALGLNFRHLTGSTKMNTEAKGEIRYKLVQNQYLVPVSISHVNHKTNGGISAGLISVIVGMSNQRIFRTFTDIPDSEKKYSANQIKVGLGISTFATRKYLGVMMRLSWIGNLLPVYKDQQDMRDKSVSPSTAGFDEYYLNYRYLGDNRRVKADAKGLNLEIGVFFNFGN